MKSKKKVTLKRTLTIWAVFFFTLSIAMTTFAKTTKDEEASSQFTSLSQYVSVSEKQMHVVLYGKIDTTGEKVSFADKEKSTIVMLPGLAVESVVIYMKPLAEELQKQFNVVIVEPFGYGLSDTTDKPRTITNINQEVNELLEVMGIEKCIMLTHSISGVYGLEFVLNYPEKIEGFIAIDNTVCEDNIVEALKMDREYLLNAIKEFNTLKNSFPSTNDFKNEVLNNPEKYGAILPEIKGYEYSKEDKEEYIQAYLNKYNATIEKEVENLNEAVISIKGKKFPDTVPVLMLTSKDNINNVPGWKEGHLNQINTKVHDYYEMEGTHALWYNDYKSVTDKIKDWWPKK